ncbi:MAG: hypothetical protein M1832_004887 [Thelocarpon impressellum]|nr:MAG: hypothetical protein M1832_004887 [Thelocarpon impressellum]
MGSQQPHYLATNTFPGATYLDYAFVGGLSISQALLVSPIATTITRIYGTRTTLLLGLFFETLALIGASFSTKIWHLFLTQGICFGWGMGLQFVGSLGVISQWFTTKRSVANGIATAGSGLGGLTYSLATNAMITRLGLPWAFRILAIAQFMANFVSAILLKDRNKQIGTTNRAFDYRLLKKPEFWLVLVWGSCSLLGYIVLLFSLPNYATSVGLTLKQASVVGAILNLGQALGRPPVGYFSDSFGRINMAGLMTFVCGILCFALWTFAKSYGVLIVFALIVGTVSGTFWATVGPVLTEVLGLPELQSGLSIVWLVLAIPTTFAEPIALRLRQQTGNIYLYAQMFTGAMYLCAALCMWFLRAWKIKELQIEAAREEKVRHGADTPDSQSPGLPGLMMAASAIDEGLLRRLVMLRRV